MARSRSFNRFSASNPVIWGVLGLFFYVTSCCFSGEERVIVLVLAPALLLASFLAWVRPRWARGLTLGTGTLTILLFAYALWGSGPSLFAVGFLLVGIWEVLESTFFWSGDSSEEMPEGAEGTGEDSEDDVRPRIRKRIAELLETGNADELFSLVFDRIVRRYGGDLDVMDLKEHERVFLLAYDAWGIIGNGGFNYLFERNIRGDPHFFETAAAFEAIGCRPAAEAFQKVFRLFPNGRPPEDAEERLRIYRSGPGTKRGMIDGQFFAADGEIQNCVHAYLHAHAEQFTELDQRPPRIRLAKKRKRRRKLVEEGAEPTAGDLVGALPHWARVAFAARCGRRVWPLFAANWPAVLAERTRAVTTALELAEQSAAAARPIEGLEDAVLHATITAGAAMGALYGFPFDTGKEPLPPDGNAAVVASFIAKTAEHAAKAANNPPTESIAVALEAFSWARQAAAGQSELEETLWRDLGQLERVAHRGQWTDQTPVPPNVWDLLE